ncbi:MAG: hypothetical protein Fues2KO_26740 [Fuerstiella sp.]
MTILRQALLKIWHGQSLTGDDLIALVLLLAMLVSLSHLITMLITRWGDRHIAFKSLLASVLVHAVCLLGLEVFDPLEPPTLMAAVEEYRPPERVTEILVESDTNVLLPESGNTPVPDRPTTPDVELNRLPTEARLMDAPELPDREAEVLDSLDTNARDVSQFDPSVVPETSSAVDSGEAAPRTAAADDPAADVETLLPESQADIYVPKVDRVVPERGDLTQLPDDRNPEMASGQVNRIDSNIQTEDASIAATASTLPSDVAVPTDTTDDTIERKAAPLTGDDPQQIAGLSNSSPVKRTLPARSFERRLPRPSRSMKTPVPGERPVRQNSQTPRTPIPLTSDYDAVRIGETSVNITDALNSAARLVDNDVNALRRRETRSATYRLRNVEARRDAARQFGGTAESEAAVELSLQWLSRMQSPDGHWDAERFGAGQVRVDENNVERDYAGRDSDTGLTALCILSFLGAGYTHEDGRYAIEVDRALDWLIRQQTNDGNLSGEARHYARMYCHAMATYALAEALGMQDSMVLEPLVAPEALAAGPEVSAWTSAAVTGQTGLMSAAVGVANSAALSTHSELMGWNLRKVDDLRLRAALLKAVTYTISQQDPDSGGWRYKFGQEGDVSMFGWQMMSLKSAAIAGVEIHPTVRDRMVQFLNSVRQGDHGGLFGYRRSVVVNGRETEPVNPVMTAEALFCQQMLGFPRDSAASRESVQYLLRNMPRQSQLNMYYWYYGTLAMYQYGGRPWEDWNSVVRDSLISLQRRDGAFAGSWDPDGPWGRYGGRLYSTALSTLTLEVYYRLLPLYRMNSEDEDFSKASAP